MVSFLYPLIFFYIMVQNPVGALDTMRWGSLSNPLELMTSYADKNLGHVGSSSGLSPIRRQAVS